MPSKIPGFHLFFVSSLLRTSEELDYERYRSKPRLPVHSFLVIRLICVCPELTASPFHLERPGKFFHGSLHSWQRNGHLFASITTCKECLWSNVEKCGGMLLSNMLAASVMVGTIQLVGTSSS